MPNTSSLLNQNSYSNGELEEALLIAAAAGDTKEVMRLCEQGTNIEAENNIGETALHLAVMKGHVETVRVLCEQGANIEAENNTGETALHWATRLKRLEILSLLCEQGANIEATDISGNTAIHWAAVHGRTDIVRILCEQRANKEATDNCDRTALHLAAYWGHTETVRYLCEQGANRDAENNERETALHLAARKSNVETARVLLSLGVNYDIQNIYGQTAFNGARNNDIRELISHKMMIRDRKPPLEVAFSAHCNFEEPSELLPYPEGQEHTDEGTRYAMGIIGQLKNANDTPNPIMHQILSYLPSMTGNKPAECMEIIANRKKPTQKIPVNVKSKDKKRNWRDEGSKPTYKFARN